jgi:toxin-antitoxin system PIN domain toxin
MTAHLVDANILIYCLRKEFKEHVQCREWLDRVINRKETLLLAELVEVALLRISTHPRHSIAPVKDAIAFWDGLRTYPGTSRISPGNQHGAIFRDLVTRHGLAGNDINDAWLAALAIECGATLVSADNGFARYSSLSWLNPLVVT